MGRQLLNIVGISTSNLQSNTFALILEVDGTKRRIPIIIGPFEAQAIAIALEEMIPSRPLTHDLIKNIMDSFSIVPKEVDISKFSEGVFYSTISLFDGTQTLEIDSRTSDAVAIAVRFDCPIYADDKVIEATAMEEDATDDISEQDIPVENKEFTIEELEEYLEELIAAENYEEASKVRDEINRRKKL